jgi:hypothetical protein
MITVTDDRQLYPRHDSLQGIPNISQVSRFAAAPHSQPAPGRHEKSVQQSTTPQEHPNEMTQQPQTDGVKSALSAAERFEQQHYETGPDGSAKELQAISPPALNLQDAGSLRAL